VSHYNGNTKIQDVIYYYDNSYSEGLWSYGTFKISKKGYTGTNKWQTSDGKYTVDQSTSFATGQALAEALGKDLKTGNATVDVYAQWRSNVLTLIYNANGGTQGSDAKYVIGEKYTRNYSSGAQDPINFSSFVLTRSGYSRKDGYEWNTKADGTGTSFDQDTEYALTRYSSLIETQDVTVTLYAQWTQNTSTSHVHSCNTRSYSSEYGATVTNVLTYWPVNDHNHWCSSSLKSETCIPSDYTGSENIPMYQVTCDVCGKSCDQRWCPVHAAGGNKTSGGGGEDLPICDAKAKKYSSGAKKCVGKTDSSLGWTQVSE
ncbi:MAG: hypothetical protein IJO43_01730, partial [Bacilli bacterium]|nr:hypothetical protein [Bacilli bacterium]